MAHEHNEPMDEMMDYQPEVYTLVDENGNEKNFELVDVLEREDNIESVTFVGLCTDICVISNAMVVKAFYPELPLIVDAKACAGVTPESHRRAIEAMKVCQIKVINE